MKMNPTAKRALEKVLNVIATVVLISAICICVLVIASIKSSTGMAQLFGYSILSVQSDSMEPIFYVGDLIVIESPNETITVEKGDVITFYTYDNYGVKYYNTHRVVEVFESNIRNSYITKGDNAKRQDDKKVYANAVLGKYTGKKLPGFGYIMDFVSSGLGILLCVVLPSALIVVWQIVSYAKSSSIRKKEFLKEAARQAQSGSGKYVEEYITQQGIATPIMSPEALELERQRVINEYLRAQREEETRKQAIIDEYLAKQREEEEASKADAEAAKIKAIVSEVLAAQQSANNAAKSEAVEDDSKDSGDQKG